MAEFILVPDARQLIPLPDRLDPVIAVPLTDAALTPYHAVRRSWPKLTPGATAVVIGVGGPGHLAVRSSRPPLRRGLSPWTRGAKRSPWPSNPALTSPYWGSDHAAQDIRTATGGRHGADVVLDCVGNDTTLALGASAARTLGDLTPHRPRRWHAADIVLRGALRVVRADNLWGEPAGTDRSPRPRLPRTAARHLTTFTLDRTMDAYRMVEAGELTGRAVVVPTTS